MTVIFARLKSPNLNRNAGYADGKTCRAGKYDLTDLKKVIADIYPGQTQFYGLNLNAFKLNSRLLVEILHLFHDF